MANNAFDRAVINLRERPLSSDINQAQAQLYRALVEVVDRQSLVGVVTGQAAFFGAGFQVTGVVGAMQVRVGDGLGFFRNDADSAVAIGSVSGVDDRHRLHPLLLAAPEFINVPAADPANPRIDIVEIRTDRRLENPLSRDTLDAAVGAFTSGLVNKTLAYALDTRSTVNAAGNLNYKTGTPAAAPVAAATTAGYYRIAEIYVNAAAPNLDRSTVAGNRNGQIADLRHLLWPSGEAVAAGLVTAGSPPALSQVVLPAGCATNVERTGAGLYTVRVVAGQTLAAVVPGGLANVAIAGTRLVYASPLFVGAATLAGDSDPAKVAANVNAVLHIAVGQPLARISFRTTDGAVVGETDFFFRIDLQR